MSRNMQELCDHTFPEEREPSGRLILCPCLSCGMTALDAMDKMKKKIKDLEDIVGDIPTLLDAQNEDY